MKHSFSEVLIIPNGVQCSIDSGVLKVSKAGVSLSRQVNSPGINTSIKDSKIIFEAKGSKKEFNVIKSYIAHVQNLFAGLEKDFVYTLEACNVHFPMTLKVEKNNLIINNFLGEKTPRHAKILPDAKVEIKGQKLLVSSRNKESAGQTVANIEKATIVRKRDRRVFQDGIFLVERGAR